MSVHFHSAPNVATIKIVSYLELLSNRNPIIASVLFHRWGGNNYTLVPTPLPVAITVMFIIYDKLLSQQNLTKDATMLRLITLDVIGLLVRDIIVDGVAN